MMVTSVTLSDQTPCEICGFSADEYDLETDITSTARLAPELVADAARGLDAEALAATPDGAEQSIAEMIEAAEGFVGTPLETAHNGLHTMALIGAQRRVLGYGPTTGAGTVTGLHASGGGVPKRAIDSADIRRGGVVGDEQNNRIHHGRPLQALCVWSADVIEELQAEGHPIVAGLAGENITIDGLDWASLHPGSQITISGIPILISSYAVPCAKVGPGFVDGHFRRIHHDDHDGWSRLYGIPLDEAVVRVGDVVTTG